MVSAYLLGRDIGALLNGEEHAAVASFIVKVRDENDRHGTQARMGQQRPRIVASRP